MVMAVLIQHGQSCLTVPILMRSCLFAHRQRQSVAHVLKRRFSTCERQAMSLLFATFPTLTTLSRAMPSFGNSFLWVGFSKPVTCWHWDERNESEIVLSDDLMIISIIDGNHWRSALVNFHDFRSNQRWHVRMSDPRHAFWTDGTFDKRRFTPDRREFTGPGDIFTLSLD